MGFNGHQVKGPMLNIEHPQFEASYCPYRPYCPEGAFPYPARMMNRDHELWGMASMLLRQHGNRAPVVVAERIGQLASEGKAEGVALWREVAIRLDRMLSVKFDLQ